MALPQASQSFVQEGDIGRVRAGIWLSTREIVPAKRRHRVSNVTGCETQRPLVNPQRQRLNASGILHRYRLNPALQPHCEAGIPSHGHSNTLWTWPLCTSAKSC
ncbi:hypothetical protein PV04_00851 [Phialophora macrospora]|uniref:Uncharacterized protein n=1 Tax=Phialophora macrospora TaxID=1851006 RepID=A0A0D2FW35_9EURO|nr:hypothetical protein PV04_00851 [Phialophora macrospora]